MPNTKHKGNATTNSNTLTKVHVCGNLKNKTYQELSSARNDVEAVITLDLSVKKLS